MRFPMSVRIAAKSMTKGCIGTCAPTVTITTNFVTPNRKAIATFAA